MQKVCENCGKEFEAKTIRKRYCNRKCADNKYYENNKERRLAYAKEKYKTDRERRIKYNKEYYKKNSKKLIQNSKDYYWDNKDALLAQKKKYRDENPHIWKNYYQRVKEHKNEYRRKYYQEHIEEQRQLAKERYKKNSEKIIEKSKKWYWDHKDEILLYRKEYRINTVFPRLLKKYQENGFNFESSAEINYARLHWSEVIKERYDFKCQRCNSNIEPRSHHIIPVSQDITKSLDLNNGIVLCSLCHDIGNKGSIHNLYKTDYTEEEFWKWFYSYKPLESIRSDVQTTLI